MPRDADATPPRPALSWGRVETDLRRAMQARGISAPAIDATMIELAPIFLSIETARVHGIDSELCWALVGIAADKARRRAQAERSRPVEADA